MFKCYFIYSVYCNSNILPKEFSVKLVVHLVNEGFLIFIKILKNLKEKFFRKKTDHYCSADGCFFLSSSVRISLHDESHEIVEHNFLGLCHNTVVRKITICIIMAR
jgi:hypothetical protein